jgi:hypothetical protein
MQKDKKKTKQNQVIFNVEGWNREKKYQFEKLVKKLVKVKKITIKKKRSNLLGKKIK